MEVRTIVGVGFAVTRGEAVGTYCVRSWVRHSTTPATEQTDYTDLSYTEAVDVMLSVLDGNRPGWQVIDSMAQPPLW